MALGFTARRIGGFMLVIALLVTGCSSPADEDDGTTTTDLALVGVTGAIGVRPTIDVHAPFAITKTTRRILVQGKGDLVQPGLRVTVDYVAVNGTDGRQFANSFDTTSSTFMLDRSQTITGMVEGLTGVTVGSRVLIAVPPGDAYGTQGNATAGIGPTDSLVFVVDVHDATKVLQRAAGKAVKSASGLPEVSLDDKSGEPEITVPKSKPPAKSVVQVLIQGSGAVVKKGQTMTAHYTGVTWPGGKVFDTSWSKPSPPTFVMGLGRVLTGWDEGLVGQKVGSQVMLVLPPDKAFGLAGRPDKGIKGTDTVVFVVDILDAASATPRP